MSPEFSRVDYLLNKYVNGTIRQDELHELMKLIDSDDNQPALEGTLDQMWEQSRHADEFPLINKEKLFESIHRDKNHKIKQVKYFRRSHYVAAAILLAVMSIGISFLTLIGRHNHGERIAQILPGSDKAVLTLADGTKKYLGSGQGQVYAGNQVQAFNLSTGTLSYVKGPKEESSKIEYHQLTTPAGGQYQVILSDGTKVWLNAATTLRFPATFTGRERLVQLSGEAYFEVAKDKAHPFRVEVNHTAVEVLGTHFDIMGYPDEQHVNTTLLEGAVKVFKGSQTALLHPGEQAVVGQAIAVSPVDVRHAVQWQKGNFDFSHEKIESIMRKIARWYDVTVQYEGGVPNETFNGVIPRSKNLQEVLDILQLTQSVHFKIKERSVIVMP